MNDWEQRFKQEVRRVGGQMVVGSLLPNIPELELKIWDKNFARDVEPEIAARQLLADWD